MDRHRIRLPRTQPDVLDGVFVVDVPELPGCMADGPTPAAAVASAQEAIALWIDTAREFGHAVPEPKGRRLLLA